MLIDISLPLSPRTAPWPADTPYSFELVQSLDRGDGCNVGRITTSPHVGTHSDAPFHYDPAAPGTEWLGLDAFVGPARVVEHLEGHVTRPVVERLVPEHVERVLFKTRRAADPTRFDARYSAFTEDGARALARVRPKLVGIDSPSVDAWPVLGFEAHRILHGAGVRFLENLDLSRAAPGEYELLALPLPLAGADAAPVRAVLRPLPRA